MIYDKLGQKSSFSGDSNCLHVTDSAGYIIMTESEYPNNRIWTTREKFQAFIDGVKAGEFDKYGLLAECGSVV